VQRADLVVVGGSFAGLTCATSAASRGVKTIVLEKRFQIGEAPATTGLLVKEAADLLDVPRRMVQKIHRVKLYSPSLRHVELYRPGYYFLATDTPALLEWMGRNAAGAGAHLWCGYPFHGATRRGARWSLDQRELECRYLVGADGGRSVVARSLGLPANRHFLVGVEVHLEGVEGVDPDCLHVFLDQQLAPGYIGWVVPGLGHVQIGLAATQPGTPQLDRFLSKLGGLFDLSRARETRRLGGLIPCGGPVKNGHLTSDPGRAAGAMLLGDAAGHVSPLTGGGIHPSLELGRAAGIAIADHLLDQGTDPAHRIESLTPRFFTKRLLRMTHDRMPSDRVADRLIDSPIMRSLAQVVFFHHRGLLSLHGWSDLVRSLARREPTPHAS